MTIFDQPKYKIKVHIHDTTTGQLYDLSDAVDSITWQTHRIASQPGSLEVAVKEGIIESDITIHPGSFIRFGVNGEDYFYGNILEPQLSNSATEGVSCILKAYDHKMLLKSTESRYRPVGMTASEFFAETITWFNAKIQPMGDPGILWDVREPSVAKLDDYYFPTYTLYNMFKESMTQTHAAEAGNAIYMIRDNLGTLEWRELSALRKPYVLGDASFTDSYTYSNTIQDSYNAIKVIRDNADLGVRDAWIKYDSGNIARWRHRQLTLEADDFMTDDEISAMIDLYLAAKNRSHRSLKMLCVGINGLQAGDGCQVRAARTRIDHALWADVVSHHYTMDSHMMDLEMFL